MKILYLSNNRFPTEKAHGLQIAKMCEAFMQERADVLLIVPNRKQPVKIDGAKEFYGLKQEISVKRIWNVDLLLSHFVPRTFAYFLQSFTFAVSFILRRLKYKNYVIYSRTFMPLIGYRGKWFFEAHTFPKTLIGRLIQQIFLRRARGLVCISQALAKKYERIYSGEILIANDGVDIELFSNLKKSSAHKNVLYTGSPYKEKGVFTLAKACEDLKGVNCIFLGGNKNEPDFKHLEKIAQNSKVISYVKHSDVPKYIANADLLVIPNSAKDKAFSEDTSPLKLFEYMASGKKILASDVPAIKAILNEKMAWFFKADDVKDLRKKIIEALNSKEERGQHAARVAKKYSWKERAKEILAFLDI